MGGSGGGGRTEEAHESDTRENSTAAQNNCVFELGTPPFEPQLPHRVCHRSFSAAFSDIEGIIDKSIQHHYHAECELKFQGSPGEQVHGLRLYGANLITGVHQAQQAYFGKTHLMLIMTFQHLSFVGMI